MPNDNPKTEECFLRLIGDGIYAFKMKEGDAAVPVTEAAMQSSAEAAVGTMKEILLFLIEAAKKTPGTWVSASSRPVKKGQGVI